MCIEDIFIAFSGVTLLNSFITIPRYFGLLFNSCTFIEAPIGKGNLRCNVVEPDFLA